MKKRHSVSSLFSRVWNSPTLTTWGNYSINSLRLVLVTPLILTKFDETEIAAWYLFASLNFLGGTITDRLALTFTRMFAFAMGGATSLEGFRGNQKKENDSELNRSPNWPLFERAYGTIGVLNLCVAWVNVACAFVMGWFGLSNIMEGYHAKATIWFAFSLLQISTLIKFIYMRYAVALRGMNYVALSNRWGIVFGLCSVVGGALVLSFGGGIVVLVLVMQFVALLGIVRNRFLLKTVEQGRLLTFKAYQYDKEVTKWSWPPLWKGFVAQFGSLGSVQLVAIAYTSVGVKEQVASYLFTIRMLQTIMQIGSAPFLSLSPMMSRLLAKGDFARFQQIAVKKAGISWILSAAGVMSLAVVGPFLLSLLNANVKLISPMEMTALVVLSLSFKVNQLSCSICSLGNWIVCYWESAVAALVSFCGMILLGDRIGVFGPIVLTYLPVLIFQNAVPVLSAKKLMKP